jgi:hypothetical protein
MPKWHFLKRANHCAVATKHQRGRLATERESAAANCSKHFYWNILTLTSVEQQTHRRTIRAKAKSRQNPIRYPTKIRMPTIVAAEKGAILVGWRQAINETGQRRPG